MKKGLKRPSSDVRTNVVSSFFIFAFTVLFFRLFQIQVLDHQKYALAAKSQHWGQYELPAIRGEIYSIDNHLLAGTQDYYLMFAEPQRVKEIAVTSKALAQYFAKSKYEDAVRESSTTTETSEKIQLALEEKYSKSLAKELLWVPLEHRVSPEQRDEILNLNLDGIGFETEPIRYYPENTLTSHVLGFVASDEDGVNKGYFGIEGSFNEELKGRKGRRSEEVDAGGIPLLIGGSTEIPAIQGSKIVLTIDRSVQYIIEQKLKEGVEKYDAKSGSVIVMDPFTGSIVAMANYPTYSPSKFNDLDAQDSESYRKSVERKNLAISETYEPGSIMKPFTVATAIDLGIVNENTTFVDDGPVLYSDAWIDNWDGKHHGVLTITQLLQKSNNIGAAWVGTQVGSKKIYEYFSNFGLGVPTNIELEGEDTGLLRSDSTWTAIDLANISFGQGISATPLQMINALNSLANGGFLLQPRIIAQIEDNGKTVEMPTKVLRRVVTKETSDRMVNLLEKAAEGGEAKFFTLKSYRISGKTGTAQIPSEGKYDPNKTNASFMGFLTDTKKFSMIVKLEQPQTSIFAAETAVPVWMNIASELVKYYGLPSDRTVEQTN